MGARPASEPTIAMRPRPASRMWGRTARSVRRVPKKLVSNCSLAAAMETSSTLPKTPKPALHTSASRRGTALRTWATPLRTESSSQTSMATQRTSGAPAGSCSGRRLVPKTSKPRSRSSSAAAAPMPDEAPVTRTAGF